jgi:hypothetical protein
LTPNAADIPTAVQLGPTGGKPFPSIVANHDTCPVGKPVKQEVNSNPSRISLWLAHGLMGKILQLRNTY